MSTPANASAASLDPLPQSLTPLEQLREARSILQDEADALRTLAQRLDASFCDAVQHIYDCRGSVIVTGIGKAGLIGQKIAATLSSTGTRSHFMHPVEAVHGDLGCLHADDVLLALSNSGETEEVLRILPIVSRFGVPIVAVTASKRSSLGSAAAAAICMGKLDETGPHGLAPSTSTTVMLAIGDALALVLARMKSFSPQQFAVFHPGGSLGRKLATVGEIMRPRDELRIASAASTVREVFVNLQKPGRRSGAVILVDDKGRLCGLYTDSDLARLLERRADDRLDGPINEVMTKRPFTTSPQTRLGDVVQLLSQNKLSEIPVVDSDHRPVGMIDITDVIGLVPASEETAVSARAG